MAEELSQEIGNLSRKKPLDQEENRKEIQRLKVAAVIMRGNGRDGYINHIRLHYGSSYEHGGDRAYVVSTLVES